MNAKYIRLFSQDVAISNGVNFLALRDLSQSAGGSFLTGIQFYSRHGFTFDLLASMGYFTELSFASNRLSYDQAAYNTYFPIYLKGLHHYDLAIETRNDFFLDCRVAINIGYRF